MYKTVQRYLRKYATKSRAKSSAWFFKTGQGQYGEGDKFIGVRVPEMREVAKQFPELGFNDLSHLLHSKIHEERFVALVILVNQFKKAQKDKDARTQGKIVKFYLKNKNRINNWDLVDVSASYIIGAYLFERNKKILHKLAKSKNLWDRRIAIVSTNYFIQKGHFKETLSLAKILINDKEDLIHKAVGWMLREVGKQDEKVLTDFLNKNADTLPRTTLRYSLERLSKDKKKRYMSLRKAVAA